MQDNKLIVLLVVVLHIKDAVLSKKSKMSYSHPPYKFRYPQYEFIEAFNKNLRKSKNALVHFMS
jgi:hypothetical protein